MSNDIFPTNLWCVRPEVERDPNYSTSIFEAVSGKEQTVGWATWPRYRYKLKAEGMRSAAAQAEFQQVAGFYDLHRGRGASFLFQDPEDHQVADHGFGVGNGVATQFQLQRALAATRQDVLGTWPIYTKRRTNLCRGSSEFTGGAWGAAASGTGVTPTVSNYADVAPDGTPTASSVLFDVGSGTTNNDMSLLVQGPFPVSGAVTLSLWVKGPAGAAMFIRVGGADYVAVALTGSWQRAQATANAVFNDYINIGLRRGGFAGGIALPDRIQVSMWGAQVEVGPAATRYIPTPTLANGSATPAYWPVLGDGFEPLTEPGPDLVLTVNGDGLGPRTLVPWQRVNAVPYSEHFDAGAGYWAGNNSTVTANSSSPPDPNAGSSGELVTATGSGVGSPFLTSQLVTLNVGTYTLSVWLKGAGATIGKQCNPWLWAAGTGSLLGGANGYPTSWGTLTDDWVRYSFTAIVVSAGTFIFRIDAEPNAGVPGHQFHVWGAQLEPGSVAGDYIPTTTAAASRTDYTLSPGGIVTFEAPPRPGAQLAWSGSFYRRCRFAKDNLPLKRIMSGLWGADGIELVSVK